MMWVFTETGFVSIVNHHEKKNNMLVRGRIKEDVIGFRDLSGSTNIVSHTPQNDYPYRTILTKKQVTKAMQNTIKKIQYTNFKEAVHDGTSRDPCYVQIWSTLVEYLQYNLTFPPNWDKKN